MKGLELCRRFYRECVSPELQKKFGAKAEELAAGLAGQGSECLGFDDELSQDHDFGPGCSLWLTQEAFEDFGAELEVFYRGLPVTFLGYTRNTMPQAAGRVGVTTVGRFYRQFTGLADAPEDNLSWFRIPEHFLACATSGEVFTDPVGEFTRIREALLSGYPRDVFLKKLAARVFTMAQAGQYNYPRILKRDDSVAASFALAEFTEAALSALHLLNGRYMPYYKWAFKSAERLTQGAETVQALRRLYALPEERRGEAVEETAQLMKGELVRLGLSSSRESFLVPHAEELMSQITDSRLKSMSISVG